MKVRKALVLSGGHARRLRPLTDHIPKALVRTYGHESQLENWFWKIRNSSVQEVTANLDERAYEKYKKTFISIAKRVVQYPAPRTGKLIVNYTVEKEPKGDLGTLRDLWEGREPLMVVPIDGLTDLFVSQVINCYETDPTRSVAFAHRAQKTSHGGLVSLSPSKEILTIKETKEPPEGGILLSAIYVFGPELRETIPEKGTHIVRDWLRHNTRRFRLVLHKGYHYDIGTPAGLAGAMLRYPYD